VNGEDDDFEAQIAGDTVVESPGQVKKLLENPPSAAPARRNVRQPRIPLSRRTPVSQRAVEPPPDVSFGVIPSMDDVVTSTARPSALAQGTPAPSDPGFEDATNVAAVSYEQQIYESARVPVPPRRVTPASVPATSADPAIQARIASLAGLSLERPAMAASSAGTSRGSSKLPWILLGVFVVGGTAYHLSTRGGSSDSSEPSAQQQAAKQPAQESRGGSLLASGYIAAKVPIVLSANMSGRLEVLKVDAGDTITKGQLLAKIADGQIRAELALAAARVRDASRQRARTAMLRKAEAATAVDLERATGAVEVASAEYRVIAQKLDETKILSPIDGTVLELLKRPGETITAGPQTAGILRVADLSALVAEVDVSEADLKNVHVGQEAEIISEVRRDKPYRGRVSDIAEQADRARGTVLVKVDIIAEKPPVEDKPPPPKPKPDPKKPVEEEVKPRPPSTALRPGMAVQVRLIAKAP
jgi:biotin carboxyl carrier protein